MTWSSTWTWTLTWSWTSPRPPPPPSPALGSWLLDSSALRPSTLDLQPAGLAGVGCSFASEVQSCMLARAMPGLHSPLPRAAAAAGRRAASGGRPDGTSASRQDHTRTPRLRRHARLRLAGALWETLVVTEVVRALTHRGIEPRLYFWRTAAGDEVDLLVDTGTRIVPVEARLSSTPQPGWSTGIARLRKDLPGQAIGRGWVVHPGDTLLPLGADTFALPFAAL